MTCIVAVVSGVFLCCSCCRRVDVTGIAAMVVGGVFGGVFATMVSLLLVLLLV